VLRCQWPERYFRGGFCDRVLLSKFALILLVFAVSRWGYTQQTPASVSAHGLLAAPDPSPLGPNACVASQPASSSISGVVTDANGGQISGASVTLTSARDREQRKFSNSNGEFSFCELPPGKFKLTITSPNMQPFVFDDIALGADEIRQLPQISMAIAGATTEVKVVVTQAEVAEEQVKAAEHQRVFGIIPNFYSSYIWAAEPLDARQKFDLAFHSLTDPIEFVGIGIIAGAEQATNTFPGYGQGAGGFAKRYGAAYADEVSGRVIGSAILPSLIHQDPRYFYKGSGSLSSRAFYAISRALVTRGDGGQTEPNYSRLFGSFAAGGLANLYYPRADRGLGLTLADGFVSIAGHAVDNLVREFFLRSLTPNVPAYEMGKP
jgi:Carboxypeptidase regulatory-like domain